MKTRKKRNKANQPFPKILSSLMKERKVTIAQVAKAIEVSSTTVHGWREGQAPTDYLAVQRLAEYLGVSFSFLLTGENEARSTKPAVTEVFDDAGEIFDGYAHIVIKKLILKK